MSPSASGMSSRASSFGQSSAEYGAVPGFGTPYIPAPDPRESWASILPCPVPSVVSSPASSLGGGDDYMGGYIPTSVPSSMIDRGVVPQSLSGLEGVKPEFDDLESGKLKKKHITFDLLAFVTSIVLIMTFNRQRVLATRRSSHSDFHSHVPVPVALVRDDLPELSGTMIFALAQTFQLFYLCTIRCFFFGCHTNTALAQERSPWSRTTRSSIWAS